MIQLLEEIAREAGQAVLPLFQSGQFNVRSKADRSPVTSADILADQIIARGLKEFSNLPILSEEAIDPDVSANPPSFWLIDPIDGTREFMQQRPNFTINIALIEGGVPVAGVVYAPALQELYAGSSATGLRLNQEAAAPVAWPEVATLVCSRSHPEAELAAFMAREGYSRALPVASSIKFCWVAGGRAHCYPRFRSLAIWDIAAGHAVSLAAGCQVVALATGEAFSYAYLQLKSPPFCVLAPGVRLQAPPG